MSKNRLPSLKDQLTEAVKSKGFNKYKFGNTTNRISDIKHLKPIFAFDYVSLSKTNFCFNSTLINAKKDYLKLIEGLKKLSIKTYDELSRDPSFHFHEVSFEDTTVSVADFIKAITPEKNFNKDHCPTVYQFEIFGAARIFGFIFDFAFYPVFFDKNHDVYERK